VHDTILTPLDFSAPVKAGRRRFWKQILPVTEIDYKGHKINFDEPFHKDLELSFAEGAYDQVPLVFADANNAHNEDPRNFGGELLDVQYRGPEKGTWGLIEADSDAAKAIKKNPRLGVSARIVQDIEKGGRSFKRAIRHVLLTMNPRVSGMEPWQAVDLSDEAAGIEVVDLTAATFEEGNPMGKTTQTSVLRDGEEIDLSALSDEDFKNLVLDLAETAEVDPDAIDDEDDDDEDEPTAEEIAALKKAKKEQRLSAKVKAKDEDDATDLSDTMIQSTATEVREIKAGLAKERWDAQRDGYISAGVPPFLVDLAEPVLSQPSAMVLDLSDDESVNATDIITKMLDGIKGVVDLSDEIGHQVVTAETKDDTVDSLLTEWDNQYS